MAIFKVTTYYQQAHFGWSETWYRNANTITDLKDPLTNLLQKRRDMLTSIHLFSGVRISQEGVTRSGQVLLPGISTLQGDEYPVPVPYTGAKELGTLITSDIRPDQIRAALQLVIKAGTASLGIRYLAGIPDDVSRFEPGTTNFVNPSWWWQAYAAWRTAIINSWLVKVQVKTGAGTPQMISTWQKQATGGQLIGAVLPLGVSITVAPGDRVVVTGVRTRAGGQRGANGQWVVDSVTAGTSSTSQVIYLLNSAAIEPANFISLGKIRKQVYDYIAPSWITPHRVGTHRRGRPFGLLRGRVSTRRYA